MHFIKHYLCPLFINIVFFSMLVLFLMYAYEFFYMRNQITSYVIQLSAVLFLVVSVPIMLLLYFVKDFRRLRLLAACLLMVTLLSFLDERIALMLIPLISLISILSDVIFLVKQERH